jgi:TfoX/Sxy family transcriptional regulator of competence genes
MAWTKAPQPLVDLFDASLPADPRIERRKMFGYPAAFVHGNMFAGLFQDRLFARLSPGDQVALEAVHGPLPFEPMPGRPMRGYARAPEPVLADGEATAAFIAQGFEHASSLPPKEKKPKKASQAGKPRREG